LIANNYVIVGQFEDMVNEAIKKESTSINNKFDTEIKKLKNRKGRVDLNVEPILRNQIEQQENPEISTGDLDIIQPEPTKQKRFLGIFKRRNKNK